MPKKTFKTIFLVSAITLSVLPFLNSFNEFLTTLLLKSGWYRILESIIVPFETRMVVVLVRLFGFQAIASTNTVSIYEGVGELHWHKILISWNCIGWQSLLILVFTFVSGLTGSYTLRSKATVLLLGFLATFLVNIVRISLIALMLIHTTWIPAVTLHNYLSTIVSAFWFIFFWWFSYSFVLEERR